MNVFYKRNQKSNREIPIALQFHEIVWLLNSSFSSFNNTPAFGCLSSDSSLLAMGELITIKLIGIRYFPIGLANLYRA